MTGLPAPDPVPGVGSLRLALFGLHVDFGQRDKAGRWVRQPTADFTCRHGCTHAAAGPADVAQFTRAIDTHHARHCPARTATKDTT